VLRRLAGKAPKRRNIEIFLAFGNTARQDASAHKNVKLFLREPLARALGLIQSADHFDGEMAVRKDRHFGIKCKTCFYRPKDYDNGKSLG
jgi:hypothetical protein